MKKTNQCQKIKDVIIRSKKTKLGSRKGITLIALVVTIVVLLILAGITINLVFSDGGIIKKAQEAGNKMNEAIENDKQAIENLADDLSEILGEGSKRTFNEIKGVNTPQLGTGMTAIKWNGSTWVDTTGDDTEWYDYSNKKWANAKTSDGSMWVWIPRYAYQISTNYHTNSSTGGTINIKFMKGTTNEAADGTTSWNNSSGSGKWNIHPAFTYGSTVPGIWVAKFEASRSDASSSSAGSSSTLKIQPGVQSWRSITISNIYSTCLSYNTTLNSHQMKNSEWGAVAYLAQSTYGKNSEVWINPNSSYITGQAGTGPSVSNTTSTYAYTDTTYGVNASTTGNVTGIYDMSGGAWEYVAAYVNNGNGNLSSYGSNLVNGAAKTKDVYTSNGDSPSGNYNAAASVYGDAVYETSSSYSGSTSWYGDYSTFPYSSSPFFERGGNFNGATIAGLFYFCYDNGISYSSVGFRPVLVTL